MNLQKLGEEAYRLGDLAHDYAKSIYNLSEKCLMAHSIRSVQQFLEDKGKGKHWISIMMASSERYLGRRALAFIQPNQTEIFVDSHVELDHQRRGIAHELGHLLFVKFNNSVPPSPMRIDPLMEDVCKTFEKDLCKRHHVFYCNQENLKRLLFQTLDDYPTPTD